MHAIYFAVRLVPLINYLQGSFQHIYFEFLFDAIYFAGGLVPFINYLHGSSNIYISRLCSMHSSSQFGLFHQLTTSTVRSNILYTSSSCLMQSTSQFGSFHLLTTFKVRSDISTSRFYARCNLLCSSVRSIYQLSSISKNLTEIKCICKLDFGKVL